jgi:hypothetical protein
MGRHGASSLTLLIVAFVVFGLGARGARAAEESARIWLGLMNGADEGATFDVRAALHVNDSLIAQGIVRCVTGLSSDASRAKEIVIPFGLPS